MNQFEFAKSQAIAGRQIPQKNLFHGWSKDEFVPFQKKIHQTINRKDKDGKYRILASWTSSVIKKDFDELLPNEIKDVPQCRSYYVFNVVQILKGIRFWADTRHYNNPIHYIFAGGDGEGTNLENLFVDMWNDPVAKKVFRLNKDYSHHPYSVEMMKSEPALQAADIAAYEMHKMALRWREKGYGNVPAEELRKSVSTLCRTDHFGLLYRRQELERSFEELVIEKQNLQIIKNYEKEKKD